MSTHVVTLTWSDMRPCSWPLIKKCSWKLDAQNDEKDKGNRCSVFAWMKWIERWNRCVLHRSDITFMFYFIWNERRVTERNVTSAGPESCAGDAGRGRSAGHVPGLCGTSALHAHLRHRLLERMERVGLLHTSEQQRYCRIPLISLLKNTSLLRWWHCWWRDYIQASGISAHGDWHKRYTSCIASEVKVVM